MHELNYKFSLPRDRSVGIGCIGSGFIMAECHLVAYRSVGFNPVAIASRTPLKARQVAERHAIAAVYDTYEQMLDNPGVQVVDIAVPPDAQLTIVEDIA